MDCSVGSVERRCMAESPGPLCSLCLHPWPPISHTMPLRPVILAKDERKERKWTHHPCQFGGPGVVMGGFGER